MSTHGRFVSDETFCIESDSDHSDTNRDYFSSQEKPWEKRLSHTDLISLNNTSGASISRLNQEQNILLKYYNEKVIGKTPKPAKVIKLIEPAKPKVKRTKVYIKPSKKFTRIIDNAINLLKKKELEKQLLAQKMQSKIDVLKASLTCDSSKIRARSNIARKNETWEDMEFCSLGNLAKNLHYKSEEDLAEVTTINAGILRNRIIEIITDVQIQAGHKSPKIVINKTKVPKGLAPISHVFRSQRRSRGNEPSPFMTATTCLSHSVFSQKKSSVSRSRRTHESWGPT
ncbi:unnamed protein product [Moneuplotes crassus]|uniref:Uncharacterized protein n=1 Tax=Euplotes crassus TaxID=5936 RepID=A0AAD2D2L0_EUPCR|nr:unnamed protein product [Moneuplotes crassus]